MAEVKEVKLYGAWGSGYCAMVHHALKLKGVAYEYIEEDLQSKSEIFIKLNPVHKKVPVLVVDGKPIAESLVILEFIEETWKEPPLLPEDPCKKAKVRFFADFIYQKIMPTSHAIIMSDGEAQMKATKEFIEHTMVHGNLLVASYNNNHVCSVLRGCFLAILNSVSSFCLNEF